MKHFKEKIRLRKYTVILSGVMLAALFTAKISKPPQGWLRTAIIADTVQVKQLNQQARTEITNRQIDLAIQHGQEALRLSDDLGYLRGQALSRQTLGQAYAAKQTYATALNFYLEAVELWKKQAAMEALAETYNEIGILYQLQRGYEKALDYFKLADINTTPPLPESIRITTLQGTAYSYYSLKQYAEAEVYYRELLEIFRAREDRKAQIFVLDKLADANLATGNYAKSLEYSEQIVRVNQKLNDAVSLAMAMNNVGYLYLQLGDKKQSSKYFRQALILNKQLYDNTKDLDLERRNAQMACNVGVSYANMREYREARRYYNEAMQIWEAQMNQQGVGQCYNYLGATYFVSGNNEQAIENAQKAAQIGNKIQSPEILLTAYQILSEAYQKNGDFRTAQFYYKQYLEARDKLTEKERKQAQALVQNQLDIEKKESEMRMLIADREKQNLSIKQLELEKARQDQDLRLKASELERLKQTQALQLAEYRSRQAEEERRRQVLQEQARIEKQRQEIAMLEQNRKLQALQLEQQRAQRDKERQRAEILDKERQLQSAQLKEEAELRRYGIGVLILLGIIIALVLTGFVVNLRQSRRLAKQNAEIESQRKQLEVANEKMAANERVLQKAYDKLKSSEQEIREKNEELQASEEELRQNMEELEATKEQIENQKEALEEAYKTIEAKNLVFTQSIKYAEKIQTAILPSDMEMRQFFADCFVIYKPKDVVSGDFYWISHQNHKIYIACIDCTGHGVPGAFMSLIGNAILNEIVNEKRLQQTHEILEALHIEIQRSLRQRENNGIEGMDIALCAIERWEDGIISLQFSGAKSSVYYFSQNELHELAGDRQGIGGWFGEQHYRAFTQQVVRLNPGDTVYLTSDGYIDSPNPKRKKIGSRRVKEILTDEARQNNPLSIQRQRLIQELEAHMQNELQRDDITFIGLRL